MTTAQRRAAAVIQRRKAAATKEGLKKMEQKAAAATGSEKAEVPPILMTSTQRGPMTVLVVGAGGNGARVVPPLSQMLRRGDNLFIMDHDIVEDRNLLRQHFTARDIGQPKAQVVADRYRKPHTTTIAVQNQVTEALALEQLQGIRGGIEVPAAGQHPYLVIIGCVDNAAARRGMQRMMDVAGPLFPASAWIDIGNEMRGGQVLLNLRNWQMKVSGVSEGASLSCNLWTAKRAMPQLLRDDPAAAARESCGERIDMQSVQVNHMAAGAAINTLSWLMLGIPFTAAGAFFSTLNTMQPIRVIGRSGFELLPDESYAIPA